MILFSNTEKNENWKYKNETNQKSVENICDNLNINISSHWKTARQGENYDESTM